MALPFFAGLFAVVTTVLWLVIGWRAMKAHEQLAESLYELRKDFSRLSHHLSERDKKPGA